MSVSPSTTVRGSNITTNTMSTTVTENSTPTPATQAASAMGGLSLGQETARDTASRRQHAAPAASEEMHTLEEDELEYYEDEAEEDGANDRVQRM